MNEPSTDLSIIIISWNVRDYLAACLDSIQRSLKNSSRPSIEVIVVESGSSDGTADLIQTRYPWVKLLAQSSNVGFTRGNNIGLQAATGRYLMLLNPDTEVVADALAQMVDFLDQHEDVGIVGPHTLNPDGTTQSTRRRFPTFITAIFESTWLQSAAPRRVLDHYYARDIADSAVVDVDWVQGSALVARREVYRQIGPLDEQYTMFSEELDWCKRARDAGWRVVYVGSADIIHYGGKSTEQVAASKHIYFQQSKLRYFRKFHGAAAAIILRLILLANYASQLLLEESKGIIGLKRTLRRERVQVYWQVIRALARG